VANETKAALDVEKLDAVADRGYFNSEEIPACEEAGITAGDAGQGGLRRPESASDAKNAAPVSGLAEPFPDGFPAQEQRPVRMLTETGSSLAYALDKDRLVEFGRPAKRVTLRLALRSTDAG
jgi:hypothetical protein